jgi:hypothetical protein
MSEMDRDRGDGYGAADLFASHRSAAGKSAE